MNINKYLTMDSEELYTFLITDAMENPSEGKILLDKLSTTQKYYDDYIFRTYVDSTYVILGGMTGEAKDVISSATKLIGRATDLKLWHLVSTNWNLLGVAYSQLGIYEKAIECYHNVIKNEKEHHLFSMASMAYNNIALIYMNFGDYDHSLDYYNRAIENLTLGGSFQPRYKQKMLLFFSNIIAIKCKKGLSSEIPSLMEKAEALGFDSINLDTKQSYYFAIMNYYFLIQDFSKSKEFYQKALDCVDKENKGSIFYITSHYLQLCNEFHLDYHFYSDELLLAESMQDNSPHFVHAEIYKSLRNYYFQIGNIDKYHEITDKYLKFLEQESSAVKERRLESLHIVESLIFKNVNLNDVVSRNTELELVAAEAIRHKNSLQQAYAQIGLINKLGQKITSSLKLNEVIELIYHNIDNNIPISIFVLMILESDGHNMRSIAYYEDGVMQPEIIIDTEEKKGFFAECYRLNKVISTGDPEYSHFLEMQRKQGNTTSMNSAIYLPLNVDGKVIGLCSIQDPSKNAYNSENISFLKGLLPYLSIALNNAVHSKTLENEIQSHLLTQKELTKANLKLKQISSLDGLTQISSRRDFDIRLAKLIETASSEHLTICLFMIDIDNFKLYNDTYGHLEGDEVLKTVAKIFRFNLNQYDGLSARFGGEEFIGACIHLSFEESLSLAEKIREDIFSLEIEHKTSELRQLSVSIGICFASSIRLENKSELMRQADSCLYEAKESGRNKVVIRNFIPPT